MMKLYIANLQYREKNTVFGLQLVNYLSTICILEVYLIIEKTGVKLRPERARKGVFLMPMNINPALPISVNEARKIMGKSADKYSDEEIEKLIMDLDMIAMLQLEMVPITSS